MLGYRSMDLAHILNDEDTCPVSSASATTAASSCCSKPASTSVLTAGLNFARNQHAAAVNTNLTVLSSGVAAMTASASASRAAPSNWMYPMAPRRLVANDSHDLHRRPDAVHQPFLLVDALANNVNSVTSTGLKRRRAFEELHDEKRFKSLATNAHATTASCRTTPSNSSSLYHDSSPLRASTIRTPSPTPPHRDPATPPAPVGSATTTMHHQSRDNKLVRIGRWTQEEEEYAMELVRQFSAGTLNLKAGTPLRSHLAAKLFCSPMRISTKLTSEWLAGQRIPRQIGRKRFFPTMLSDAKRKQTLATLEQLELAFLKIEDIEFLKNYPCENQQDAAEGSSSSEDADSEDATGLSGNDSPVSGAKSETASAAPQRVGSWSEEEHEFAIAMIEAFNYGLLDIPQGTTLRSYLSKQLCCNPMRITKKLATRSIGNRSIPKRLGSATFCRRLDVSLAEKEACAQHLRVLQVACFPSMQEEFCGGDEM